MRILACEVESEYNGGSLSKAERAGVRVSRKLVTKMYKSFTAKNFRCFEDLTVGPLERFNLIAGKNNVGKTALLEALWQHHGYFNPRLPVSMNAFRGLGLIKKSEFMWDLFLDFDAQRGIELSSLDQDGRTRTLLIKQTERSTSRISLEEAGNGRGRDQPAASDLIAEQSSTLVESEILFECVDVSGEATSARAFVQENSVHFEPAAGIKEPSGILLTAHQHRMGDPAERLKDLEVVKEEDRIARLLRIIEPDLTELRALPMGGGSMIWADTGMDRLMPLPLAGEGMVRLSAIALAVSEAKDGLLLVDEIDSGLHYTVLTRVWRAIAALAREYNVQLFATTHSFECIRAAHLAFADDEQYDFRLHRLDRVKGKIRSVTYDRETLEAALEMGVEVR